MKPIRAAPAWAVVDTDGRVCWGLVFTVKGEASDVARHPQRRIVRLKVAGEVRKTTRRRKEKKR